MPVIPGPAGWGWRCRWAGVWIGVGAGVWIGIGAGSGVWAGAGAGRGLAVPCQGRGGAGPPLGPRLPLASRAE